MKVIPTNKANLRTKSDVVKMMAYVYGKDRAKVLSMVVNKHFPGVVTGEPRLDASSLTACHPGGRPALSRNIVMSSTYFNSREDAEDHLPGMKGVVSSFIDRWLPNSPALGVIHLSTGKGRYVGRWRLDAHILATNYDLSSGRALQFTKDEVKSMQLIETYVSSEILTKFNIVRGKGNGELIRPRGPLIYLHSKGIESLALGKLTNQELESYVTTNELNTRRRKDGSIISITTEGGRRINIANARTVYATVTGGGIETLHSEALLESTSPTGLAGFGKPWTRPPRNDEAGPRGCVPRGQDSRREVGDEAFLERRVSRLVRSGQLKRNRPVLLSYRTGPWPDQPASMANNNTTRTLLTQVARIKRAITEIETIELIQL